MLQDDDWLHIRGTAKHVMNDYVHGRPQFDSNDDPTLIFLIRPPTGLCQQSYLDYGKSLVMLTSIWLSDRHGMDGVFPSAMVHHLFSSIPSCLISSCDTDSFPAITCTKRHESAMDVSIQRITMRIKSTNLHGTPRWWSISITGWNDPTHGQHDRYLKTWLHAHVWISIATHYGSLHVFDISTNCNMPGNKVLFLRCIHIQVLSILVMVSHLQTMQ